MELLLTPGQASDLGQAEPLIEDIDLKALLADKAYDANRPDRAFGADAKSPRSSRQKPNRAIKRACDFVLYCERNLVERFFNKLKQYRAIATRYDKLARNFLAGVHLAASLILLN